MMAPKVQHDHGFSKLGTGGKTKSIRYHDFNIGVGDIFRFSDPLTIFFFFA
jgi:hypothetical protein